MSFRAQPVKINSLTRRETALLLAAVIVAAAVLWLRHKSNEDIPLATRIAPPMQSEPRTMLWAWETPEDLRGLDTSRTGVAFLAAELRLGADVSVRPRMQPLVVDPNAWAMAVVRLEPTAAFADSPSMRIKTARAIVAATAQPGVRAVQVDFDATATQRDFYAAVLHELRKQLPNTVPLSVTALVSWCGSHSWLNYLPVDEAVPMFFRMGGPAATGPRSPRSQAPVRAALCLGSVGVSTDEAWPAIGNGQRVYVFRNGPWSKEDIARVNALGYRGLDEQQGDNPK